MSLSALGKFILPPVIAAAGVFSAMSLPLAMMGDKPVGIRYEEEPVFDGRIRDIAPPYVVFVTALSFGVGIGVAAIGGWRSSARKSSQFQHQLSTLEDDLQQKDKLLKELKLSESRLQVSGLANFLDDEVPFDQPALKALPAVVTQPVVQEPVVAQTPAQKYQQYSPSPVPTMAPKPMATPKVATARVMPSQPTTVTSVASSFASAASAQAFLNYDKSNQVADKATANSTQIQPVTSDGSFEAIQQQLREMMEQMRAMQNSMQQTPQGASVQTSPPSKFQVYYEAPNSSETKFQ
ncbi:MAG: hypothetical protein KME29_13835 [Calothrix sp. FI2-JRJ7]|jgi:hypothetical protein|nr:hypothetical protein [Calothrix sp. FI2-JRJ7]